MAVPHGETSGVQPAPIAPEFSDQTKTSFTFASDLIKQLITLSTGLIGVTVTFQKDIIKAEDNFTKDLLVWSWIALLASVVFGVIAMMGLTGTLSSRSAPASISGRNVRAFPILQSLTFGVAVGLMVWFGARSI